MTLRHWIKALALTGCVLGSTIPALPAIAAPAAPISTFDWMVGIWRADAMGGQLENMFQPAVNGEMLCTLQVVINHKIVRYELCAISRQPEGTMFRVAAFDEGMTPAPPVAPRLLLSAGPGAARFDGITFVNAGSNRMVVTVMLPTPDGAMKPTELHYTRVSRIVGH